MRRLAAALAAAFALCLPLAACGDQVPSSTESSQQQRAAADELLRAEGFGCRTLTVRAVDGTTTTSCVWAATTPELRERGLMGVTDPSIGGRDAMVFVFPGPSTTSFWMKDTLIALTVVWVSASGSVLGSTDMVPCPAGTTCPTYAPPGPYTMAIEVARGRAPDLGLVPGAMVTFGEPCTAQS